MAGLIEPDGTLVLDLSQIHPQSSHMPLYHRDAYGLPKLTFKSIEGLTLSNHALARAEFKQIEISGIDLTAYHPKDWELFELEVINGVPVKLAARRDVGDNINDLVIVVLRKERLIKTLWYNKKTDKHFTLDKSVYSVP